MPGGNGRSRSRLYAGRVAGFAARTVASGGAISEAPSHSRVEEEPCRNYTQSMRIRMFLELVRLGGCLFLEAIVTLFFHLPRFLACRNRERARVARHLAAWSVVAFSLLGAPGCETFERGEGIEKTSLKYSYGAKGYMPGVSGASLGRQLEELADSAAVLLGMGDAQASLEDEFLEFGRSEPDAFRETILLLGW